jgi:tubulysin polyketide synthase-like protein
MIAKDLMAKCEALGVTLAPGDHGALRVRPPGVLPDDLKRLLKAHKVAILNLLAGPPLGGCYTCQQRRYWQHAETYRWICAACHRPAHIALVEAWYEVPEPATP